MKKTLILILIAFSFTACKADKKAEKECCKKELPALKTDKAVLPEQSIYQVPSIFANQDNQAVKLADFQGKPTVVGMIFTNCGYACPRLTADMRNLEKNLKENVDKVNFLLISFDTERDTPEALKKYAETNGLDQRWTLLHGDEESVRTIAVLLNVQFEKDKDGDFAHSNLISVLDKDGVLQFQKEGLEVDHKNTLAKINQLLN